MLLDWLSFLFGTIGTAFGIWGTLIETHEVKRQVELDAEGWTGTAVERSWWEKLTKKGKIAFVSALIGILGSLVTTYLGARQKEEDRVHVEQDKLKDKADLAAQQAHLDSLLRADAERVDSSLQALDHLKARISSEGEKDAARFDHVTGQLSENLEAERMIRHGMEQANLKVDKGMVYITLCIDDSAISETKKNALKRICEKYGTRDDYKYRTIMGTERFSLTEPQLFSASTDPLCLPFIVQYMDAYPEFIFRKDNKELIHYNTVREDDQVVISARNDGSYRLLFGYKLGTAHQTKRADPIVLDDLLGATCSTHFQLGTFRTDLTGPLKNRMPKIQICGGSADFSFDCGYVLKLKSPEQSVKGEVVTYTWSVPTDRARAFQYEHIDIQR